MGRQFQKEEIMKCPLCETGNLQEGTTTVTLEKEKTVIVFRNVPAFVCDQCGYAETDEDVTEHLLYLAREEAARVPREAFIQYVA
jgi:YgiT-type zinc finger domain-containing protein